MSNFVWKCICCEKEIPFDTGSPGDDHEGLLPCLEGGTLDIHFGWFSKFDQLEDMMSHGEYIIQGAICDDCFEKKNRLTRKVELRKNTRFVEVSHWSTRTKE